MDKLTIRDIDVESKRVFVRVDFNVPQDKQGNITDDSRIRAAIPTINYLRQKGARVILASHLGRPKGIDNSLRLKVIADRLAKLLKSPVGYTTDCIGPEAEGAVAKMKNGDVVLLENLRFHPEEEKNEPKFAAALAKLADIYVNDAFGTAHRAHASITGVAERFLPAVAGFLMEKELENMGDLLKLPARPFTVLLGGAKVSDKIALIDNLLPKANTLLIGGGMAATFFKALKREIGKSLVEDDKIEMTRQLMDKTEKLNVELKLPTDVLVASEIAEKSPTEMVSAYHIPADKRIVDIGPETLKTFIGVLQQSKTIFWNGPMGIFEIEPFSKGTRDIANVLADLKGVKTIIGGGSTGEAVENMGLTDKMTFVSTGGGATLEFLSGIELPGVKALKDKNPKKPKSAEEEDEPDDHCCG